MDFAGLGDRPQNRTLGVKRAGFAYPGEGNVRLQTVCRALVVSKAVQRLK